MVSRRSQSWTKRFDRICLGTDRFAPGDGAGQPPQRIHYFGAICPSRSIGAALVMASANTEAMNEHLKEISVQVATGAHAALLCDGAGWHAKSKDLIVPSNITLITLPPYAPELNPMENVC